LSHGFNIQYAFQNGIQYLSREEEMRAIALERNKQDRDSVADIHLRDDEVESLDFVRRTRGRVEKWLKLEVVGYG
jgi:poly(A)-specific ribonuclease